MAGEAVETKASEFGKHTSCDSAGAQELTLEAREARRRKAAHEEARVKGRVVRDERGTGEAGEPAEKRPKGFAEAGCPRDHRVVDSSQGTYSRGDGHHGIYECDEALPGAGSAHADRADFKDRGGSRRKTRRLEIDHHELDLAQSSRRSAGALPPHAVRIPRIRNGAHPEAREIERIRQALRHLPEEHRDEAARQRWSWGHAQREQLLGKNAQSHRRFLHLEDRPRALDG
jgi:hypothetical protein